MIIAFLGSLFTALVDRQQIIEIQEKAKMTLDLELIFRFVKTRFRRKFDEKEFSEFVFVIQKKEYDYSFEEGETQKSEKAEENKKLVTFIKSIFEKNSQKSERFVKSSIQELKDEITTLKMKVKKNSINFRQQNI
jgi:hypothetical protein